MHVDQPILVQIISPGGEEPLAKAVAVAGGVVLMSHVESADGVVNISRRCFGRQGCSLPDFHAGLCTSVIIDSKRKRKSAVKWPEGSDEKEDGGKQADISRRNGSAPMSLGEQGLGAVAAPAFLWATTRTTAAMSAGLMVAGSRKDKHERCEHGRRRQHCKECGGSGLCEHGRQRHRCKECGGASICEHGRRRQPTLQGVRRPRHLRARAGASILQGVRWHIHL